VPHPLGTARCSQLRQPGLRVEGLGLRTGSSAAVIAWGRETDISMRESGGELACRIARPKLKLKLN